MGMAAFLFNGPESFDQIVNIISKDWRHDVKYNESCLRVSEKNTFKDFMILYMYIARGKGR